MPAQSLDTPVALFVFKRPETTRLVFEAISKVKPGTLLLVADGPRREVVGEAESCRLVREILTQVDWPCEVFKSFSENNLGCGERMVSGLNWVFSLVEEAIILEDDCLPDLSFFHFCQELLEKFRADDRIAYISGDDLVKRHNRNGDSYYFSQIGGIWGWATWKSEWMRYDRYLKDWPQLKKQRMLEEIFGDPKAVKFYTEIFDAMHDGRGPDTWDYQWVYTNLTNNSLVVVPNVNLITNIGFGEGATHTTKADSRFTLTAFPMKFPLRHPLSFIPMRSLDLCRTQKQLPPSIPRRIVNRLHRLATRFGDGATPLA
ncbi:MAG TPA: hypothetical protein VGG45_01210 [Terracidiphilus sp.]|jgi:hypothetical protein